MGETGQMVWYHTHLSWPCSSQAMNTKCCQVDKKAMAGSLVDGTHASRVLSWTEQSRPWNSILRYCTNFESDFGRLTFKVKISWEVKSQNQTVWFSRFLPVQFSCDVSSSCFFFYAFCKSLVIISISLCKKATKMIGLKKFFSRHEILEEICHSWR